MHSFSGTPRICIATYFTRLPFHCITQRERESVTGHQTTPCFLCLSTYNFPLQCRTALLWPKVVFVLLFVQSIHCIIVGKSRKNIALICNDPQFRENVLLLYLPRFVSCFFKCELSAIIPGRRNFVSFFLCSLWGCNFASSLGLQPDTSSDKAWGAGWSSTALLSSAGECADSTKARSSQLSASGWMMWNKNTFWIFKSNRFRA